jgi:signal transduction histidine kinase
VGLGLSIVKALVDAMHASVECRNRPEGGAEFVVYFARRKDGASAASASR